MNIIFLIFLIFGSLIFTTKSRGLRMYDEEDKSFLEEENDALGKEQADNYNYYYNNPCRDY